MLLSVLVLLLQTPYVGPASKPNGPSLKITILHFFSYLISISYIHSLYSTTSWALSLSSHPCRLPFMENKLYVLYTPICGVSLSLEK